MIILDEEGDFMAAMAGDRKGVKPHIQLATGPVSFASTGENDHPGACSGRYMGQAMRTIPEEDYQLIMRRAGE